MLREGKFELFKPNGNYTYATTCCRFKEPCNLPEQITCNFATVLTVYRLYPQTTITDCFRNQYEPNSQYDNK